MYRLKDILESFRGLVGWEQSRSRTEKIRTDLTKSDSGLYFQEAHPLLTLRTLSGVAPENMAEAYPEWSDAETYMKGDKVNKTGKTWISLVDDNIGNIPIEGENWAMYNPLSDYLEKITDNGIKRVITRYIQDKVIGMETKNLIDRRALFDGAGRINNRIENQGRVCGFEIVPLRSQGITMKIEKIGLQFIGNTGIIDLYLFHSSCAEPIWHKEVTYDKLNGTFVWVDTPDLYLPYISKNTNAGGSYYLAYNQKALPAYMEAINFARDWSREPCGTCNQGDVQLWRMMNKYVQVSPFCVDVEDGWTPMLWGIQNNIYTNTRNYGINIQFSIGCDLTDFMIEQRDMFASVIQKQVATDALRTIALNPEVRVNRSQANVSRDNILYETDGNGQGIKGLQGELEKAYKALSFDTKNIDRICLSCKTGGVKIRAI